MKFTIFLQEEVTKIDNIEPIEGVKYVFFKARGVKNWRDNIDDLVWEVSGTPIVFCSIQVAKYIQKFIPELASGLLISNQSPEPQIGMPSIFDWNQYSMSVPCDVLLNKNFSIHRFGDLEKPWTELPKEMFVRPIGAWKPFAGFSCPREFLKGETNALYQLEHVMPHELVAVFPKQDIVNEYRYWIVDSRISTSSSYGWEADHEFKTPPNACDQFVNTVIPYFDQIGLTDFVLDVGQVEQEYKLLEINALSTSGWYDAMDSRQLILDIMKLF